jgi:hypothetical protein
MTRDKQLQTVDLNQVIEKRRLDQALNVKEFAVLAGVSYSTARAWFRMPNFPAFSGVVFWADFVRWRNVQTALREQNIIAAAQASGMVSPAPKAATTLPARASKLLSEAG